MWLVWWSEPALVIEWVLCPGIASALSGPGSAPSLLQWKPPDLFLGCLSELQCQADGNRALPLGEEPGSFSARAVHQWVCSVVILATPCADAQSAALLAPSVGPSSTLECQQLALGSLSCFHKSTSTDPLKSCPGTVVVVHLDPLWELLRPSDSGPAQPPCTRPAAAPTVLLGVLQMPSLQSWCWKWKFAACATTGRDFSPAF